MRFSRAVQLFGFIGLSILASCKGGDGDDDGDDVPTDGSVIGNGCMPNQFAAPTITTCAGDAMPSLAQGTCEVTAGDSSLLITGDVLTPGEVLRGGQVLVDSSGMITCVGCDCSSESGASAATRVACPDGVVSPGLINGHDHISFDRAPPYQATDERYEHRHDWRKMTRGHTAIPSQGFSSTEHMQWHELRQVMSGTTSVMGAGGPDGLLRNLDSSSDMEGLGQPAVDDDTFPYGDNDGELLSGSCNYPSQPSASDVMMEDAYTPHVAEGIDNEARNEFLCGREGDTDIIQDETAIIHGAGLLAIDIAEMATDGAALIWSPRTNITLYGDTARVTEYALLGVPISLGTDWLLSGSMNMLRELQCAASFNRDYLDGFFSDEQIWRMATANSAAALAVDDAIGTLAEGMVADIAIYDAGNRADYAAVIEAEPEDVVLVLRGGKPLYGDDALITGLGAADCDTIDVCSTTKRVCLSSEIGSTLTALSSENSDRYGLFYCDTIPDEPSCIPERNASSPSPEVNGSNRYTGLITDTDGDGDGIADADDNCPCTFNPIRPLDQGQQGDTDEDGLGDACDVCPLNANTATCSPPDPTDHDADGIPNESDNCPSSPNPDQADGDNDGHGDVCDDCPADANPGAQACPATIYQVKGGTLDEGAAVAIMGALVTAVGGNGFFLQIDPDDASYDGEDNSGVFVYTGDAPTVASGDRVDVTRGTITTFNGQIQLAEPTLSVTESGQVLPDPIAVTAAEVATGGERADALEAVLIEVTDVTVTDRNVDDFEFEVADSLPVDDFVYRVEPTPEIGVVYESIAGVLAFREQASKLLPRAGTDLVLGPPVLLAVEPAMAFARIGNSSAIPEPLMVRLSAPATAETGAITLMSSTPGDLAVPATVMVPVGLDTVEISLTGMNASTTLHTITATLDGREETAMVRVVAVDEVPTLVGLTPTATNVNPEETAIFTLTLDIPAPSAGAEITLDTTSPGTILDPVTIAADQLTTTFMYTAPEPEGLYTITASFMGTDLVADVTVQAGSPLVINEVDYDNPGTDDAQFIELYNRSGPLSLSDFVLIFVNGSNDQDYACINLSGSLDSGEYLVFADDAVSTPSEGVTRLALFADIQNGGPDGILLVDNSTEPATTLDALSYEGEITAAMLDDACGVTGTFNLVRGTATEASDPGAGSMIRSPDGNDTQDASVDWSLTTTLTPGAANPTE